MGVIQNARDLLGTAYQLTLLIISFRRLRDLARHWVVYQKVERFSQHYLNSHGTHHQVKDVGNVIISTSNGDILRYGCLNNNCESPFRFLKQRQNRDRSLG